jgi:prepilin-type N-terminal cleavage/methylation domain-containing protein
MTHKERKTMSNKAGRRHIRPKGFSLIEVLIGVSLMAVAILGLAQLFMLGMLNNVRAGEIANAVFLAQQQVDNLRPLTSSELTAFIGTGANDELIDINADGTTDFRRVTVLTDVTTQGPEFTAEILVFPTSQALTARNDLISDPARHKVRARMQTTITR